MIDAKLLATALSVMMAMEDEMSEGIPKCRITGNPCGTDTAQRRYTCNCIPCQKWFAENAQPLYSGLIIDKGLK